MGPLNFTPANTIELLPTLLLLLLQLLLLLLVLLLLLLVGLLVVVMVGVLDKETAASVAATVDFVPGDLGVFAKPPVSRREQANSRITQNEVRSSGKRMVEYRYKVQAQPVRGAARYSTSTLI